MNKGDHSLRQILYIGKANSRSSTLKTRYKNEYSKIINSELDVFWSNDQPKNRKKLLQKHLNLDILEYWFLAIDKPTPIIDDLETDLIKLFSPPANSINKNRDIRAKTEQPITAF